MKACPSCKSRNEERSLFCNDCGARLPQSDSPDPAAGGDAGGADPRTASMHGDSLEAALAGHAPSHPTPVAPVRAPPASDSCRACGFGFPAGTTVSWCPGCGALVGAPRSPARETAPPGVAPPVAPAAAVPAGWFLVLLKAGERLDRYPLRKAEMILGRSEGDYVFPEDLLLSPRHARVHYRSPSFWVEDLDSRNGIYLRLREAAQLVVGDLVNLGSLLFRYEAAGSGPSTTGLLTSRGGVKPFGSGRERARGRLVRILQDGSDGPVFPLVPSRTILGRKLGHFLFPDDPLLSRQHAQFYERDGEMWVEDLGSSNGTLLRTRGPAMLERGLVLRVGDVTLEVVAP